MLCAMILIVVVKGTVVLCTLGNVISFSCSTYTAEEIDSDIDVEGEETIDTAQFQRCIILLLVH